MHVSPSGGHLGSVDRCSGRLQRPFNAPRLLNLLSYVQHLPAALLVLLCALSWCSHAFPLSAPSALGASATERSASPASWQGEKGGWA
jgi:hypothetical protein